MNNGVEIAALPDSEAFRILAASPISMVLTDPSQADNPIIYVNNAFERVTGYDASVALGRNCRFLQGEATDPEDIRRIRHALSTATETTVDIVNYTALGTRFLNRLLLTPIFDEAGELRYFLGIQKRLTDSEARNSVNVTQHAIRELKHRVKNHIAMIVSMIRLEGRGKTDGASVASLSRRVESLQLLYEELSEPSSERRAGYVALGAYVSRLVNTTAHLDSRAGIRVNTRFADATCNSEKAAHIGLVVSEILTNTFQHAFDGRDEGSIEVSLDQSDDGTITIVVSDDGVGLPEGTTWPDSSSMGGRVVSGLLVGLQAGLDVTSGSQGTTITLTIPPNENDR